MEVRSSSNSIAKERPSLTESWGPCYGAGPKLTWSLNWEQVGDKVGRALCLGGYFAVFPLAPSDCTGEKPLGPLGKGLLGVSLGSSHLRGTNLQYS